MKEHIQKIGTLRWFWFWAGNLTMLLTYTTILIFTNVTPAHVWDLVRVLGMELIIAMVGLFLLNVSFLIFMLRPYREKPTWLTFWTDNWLGTVFAGIAVFVFSRLDRELVFEILDLLE